METDEQAIRSLVDAWMKATRAGNMPRVLDLMDDEVVFLGPGRPPMRGKQAFAAAAQATQGRSNVDGHSTIQEVRVFGDWAYCWNELQVTIRPVDNGPATHLTGPVLSVLRKRPDGTWVIVRDANMLTPSSERGA